jgi:hypothetical protein
VFRIVIPLMFLRVKPRHCQRHFSDMDSWFIDVHEDMNGYGTEILLV